MTIDDESSIYVGGLPYDATEDTLRRVFDLYGTVVAVKIINDRTVGGKCYGFVTFRNPRSAMHAIKDMDGKTIDGRVVRVNEVKSRGGRSNFGRERFRRNSERGMDDDRGKDRERDYDYDDDRYHDARREWSRDREQAIGRAYDSIYDHDRQRDHFVDRERVRDHSRDVEDIELEHERNNDRYWERDPDQDPEIRRAHDGGDKNKGEMPEVLNGRNFDERSNRELSEDSSGDNQNEVERQLQVSNKKLEELQEEISHMEELVEEKQQSVSKLHEKSQKLEESLTAAKKLTSYRQMQFAKLHKCYLQVRDFNERMKNSEQELQSLVNSTMMELEVGDGGTRDGLLTNGNT